MLENADSINANAADQIAKMMMLTQDENASEHIKAQAFMFLLEVKQSLVDNEQFEQLRDWKKIEDWNDCFLPFTDLVGNPVVIEQE